MATQLRLILAICTAAFVDSTSSALAWRQLGHSIIAEQSQRHLSRAAQATLKELVGDSSLAGISNWADDYKFTPEGKNTYRWHFVDIDIERPAYDVVLDCQDENNQGTRILQGLPAAIAILKDNLRSEKDGWAR
ncbi:S1/P1 nuclease [Bradyrhizobium sp. AC87j1]|uniref:S1/P1 nuclease n=1 Tax=Bradyrhizobium sp. AC87j1 TaxID=2055894 RepID=UPI00137523D6|nr:S1/P1 nuclease [Bradyrhizobium sp. AC87j1]